MKERITKLSRLIGVAAVGVGLLGSAGCDQAKKAAEACDLTCPTDADGKAYGIVEGNASISGFKPIDGFFQSVVNFKGVAGSVSADIQAEVDAIALAVGLDPVKLKGEADVGGKIAAKLKADFDAQLTVNAQPPKCEVDAQVTAKASLDCQAKAECKVDPGKVEVDCKGECTVEASAEGKCDASAELKCEFSGPSVECTGECSGSCTAELTAAAACSGTCKGMCDGECKGDTDSGAGCNGQCTGMCQGSCEVTGMAALDCKGTCNGTCKATPPMGSCEASAKASCDVKAEAKASCKGKCDGDFEPPKADCDAQASCDASAKADAKFNASCTPPSIDVQFVLGGGVDVAGDAAVQARFDFVIGELKAHLPRLFAGLKKGDLVFNAGVSLAADAKTAVKATLDGVANGNVDAFTAYKIGSCVPDQLEAVGGIVTGASASLKASYCAGFTIGAGLGGGMDGLDPSICS